MLLTPRLEIIGERCEGFEFWYHLILCVGNKTHEDQYFKNYQHKLVLTELVGCVKVGLRSTFSFGGFNNGQRIR